MPGSEVELPSRFVEKVVGGAARVVVELDEELIELGLLDGGFHVRYRVERALRRAGDLILSILALILLEVRAQRLDQVWEELRTRIGSNVQIESVHPAVAD